MRRWRRRSPRRPPTYSVASGGQVAMGQSNHTSFLRPVTEGIVHAQARCRHRGRTSWVWEVDFTDERGRLCALNADDRSPSGQRPPDRARSQPRARSLRPGGSARLSYRFVIGSLRSRPNAFVEMRMPGGAWRRLYSARSTILITRSTSSAGWPERHDLACVEVLLDVGRQDRVEHVVRRQRVLVELVGAQLGRGRTVDGRGGDQLPSGLLVAPAHEPVDPALEHVLEHREAAGHVPVERGVAHRQLATCSRS